MVSDRRVPTDNAWPMRSLSITALTTFLVLAACNQPAPSWQQLLAGKITQHYPTYTTSPAQGGNLTVHRPGKPDVQVDVIDIAQFCRRGHRDCDYATDQMLLKLGE